MPKSSLSTSIYLSFHLFISNPSLQVEILHPAIKGTLNVLRSCKKNPSLRRVVLTSSSSAVRVRAEEEFDPAVPLDENSWSSVDLCERLHVSQLTRTVDHLLTLHDFLSLPADLTHARTPLTLPFSLSTVFSGMRLALEQLSIQV